MALLVRREHLGQLLMPFPDFLTKDRRDTIGSAIYFVTLKSEFEVGIWAST